MEAYASVGPALLIRDALGLMDEGCVVCEGPDSLGGEEGDFASAKSFDDLLVDGQGQGDGPQ